MVSIENLTHNPRPPGCVKLHGSENQWRIRIGWNLLGESPKKASVANISESQLQNTLEKARKIQFDTSIVDDIIELPQ